MINRSTIDQVVDLPIEEVIPSYGTPLKRKGANYSACCPFHDEKTASFVVSPAKGIFKCFGCGEGGDLITFVMKIEELNYPQAIKDICERFSVDFVEDDVDPEMKARQERNMRLYAINETAMGMYIDRFDGSKSEVVLKDRGFTVETLKRFNIGHSLSLTSDISTELMLAFDEKDILDSGNARKSREGMLNDFFRSRAIFPLHNRYGKVIGFAGRKIKDDDTAKYINTPDTTIFHKRKELYGLHITKHAIKQQNLAYIVEGYTDVMSMVQHGIENVVASCGTAFTPEQATLLKKFTTNVVLLYDGDKAGLKAMIKAMDVLVPNGFNVFAVPFRKGADPDQLVREMGGEAFQEMLESKKKDFVTVMFSLLTGAGRMQQEIPGAVDRISKLIATCKSAIHRDIYRKTLTTITGVSEQSMEQREGVYKNMVDDLYPETKIARLALVYPDREIFGKPMLQYLVTSIPEFYETFGLKFLSRQVEKLIKYAIENNVTSTSQLINSEDEDIANYCQELLVIEINGIREDIEFEYEFKWFTLNLFQRVELNYLDKLKEEDSKDNPKEELLKKHQLALKGIRDGIQKKKQELSSLLT